MTAIPAGEYEVHGVTVEIPADGIGGSIRVAPTNPAWIWRKFRELLVASEMPNVDKVMPPIDDDELYILATICDEPVLRPDGTMGPRYEFNGAIACEADLIRIQMMMASAIAIAESRIP